MKKTSYKRVLFLSAHDSTITVCNLPLFSKSADWLFQKGPEFRMAFKCPFRREFTLRFLNPSFYPYGIPTQTFTG